MSGSGFCRAPTRKNLQPWPGHQPVEFCLSSPGQQFEAILQKVTPFNQPTGELTKDVAAVKLPVLTECQQLIVFQVLTRTWSSVCVSYFFAPVETGAPPFGTSFYICTVLSKVKGENRGHIV